MTFLVRNGKSNGQRDIDSDKGEGTETNVEDDEEEEEEEDSGNDDEEDFLSEDLNIPETEDDVLETDSVPDYPVILDDSEEDLIFKRQLSYPPIPTYHPPRPIQKQPISRGGRPINPRDKIGMLTPMEEVTEPPSSAATSRDGEHRRKSRNKKSPQFRLSPTSFPQPPSVNLIEQKSILKSRENLQDGNGRRVTFEGGASKSSVESGDSRRLVSPAESLVSITSEYSSLIDSGKLNDAAKHDIQRTITEEETEEPEDNGIDGSGRQEDIPYRPPPSPNNKARPPYSKEKVHANPGKKSTDLGLISDLEQGEKVIHWQIENAKSESSGGEASCNLDSEFPSIVNGIIAELHNLDELIGSSFHRGAMEMNASKQDHLANVSTQLATYLAQVSPQTVLTNLPQVIPLVTSLLYLTGSNFRSQLASLTAVNVFVERLRDCKTHSRLRVLPNADLTWLVRALCEISSDSSRSVLKNEGVLALARLIKTAGPEMVFDPILFILMGNDEKVRKTRRDEDNDEIVIPTGGPGGAPKLKAIALDALTFALLTFPRDDFNLDLVGKLACHCLLHPKRRMRQASLECLSVVSHALGSHIALPMFRQVIVAEQDETASQQQAQESNSSISSDASALGSGSSEQEGETDSPPRPTVPSKIPVLLARAERPEVSAKQVITPQQLKPTGSPISAVSARISRHLLPTPSLNDLVEYAVKIPASSKLFSRQNLAVSRQEDIGSGGESGESGGSANMSRSGRRAASSGGTSCSSVTNVEIELEPVLNALGSGRRKQINEVAGSVMAADVAWILNGSGPIKTCDGTSVLAPIYRLSEKQLLVSDMNLTSTHLRQLGMVHSSGMESDSNVSESFVQQLEKMSSSLKPSEIPSQMVRSNPNGQENPTDPSMSRYYYGSGGSGGRGMGGPPPDNNNGGRISSSTPSYSLLPNKYSLVGSLGGRAASSTMQLGGGDPMMSPHHVPTSYDYPHYGSSVDGIDGYGSASALNSSDLYNEPASLRAPSRTKMGPMQPVHSLRQKYFDSAMERGNMKTNYLDDEEDVGIGHRGSESSAASSDEEDDLHQQMRQQEALMKERRSSQTSVKFSQNGGKNNKSKKGKGGKSGKHASKKGQKTLSSGTATAGGEQPDKVEQIVNRLQQEYQVFRVDRVELDQPGPSPEELAAAAKKKRGELDSAGSNSRDSGVSIGAGSVASVHTPPGESQPQQQASLSPEDDENSISQQTETISGATNTTTNGSNNKGNSNGKKEGSKRKSSLKTGKKLASSKAVQHAVDGEDVLSRNWKSTPDVASIMDDYEPRMSNYRLSNEHGVAGHDMIGNSTSPYHSSSALNGGGDNAYMTLHRKPVMAGGGGRRQSLSRPAVDLGELEDRQLALIPQQEGGRASRQEYHQQTKHNHGPSNQLPSYSHLHNGGGGYQVGGFGLHNNHHDADHYPRHNSMLDIDKAPSRESSAGSGNTYSLHQHEPSMPSHHHLHTSLAPHNNLRSSKSTGNLLGVGMEDSYRQPMRGGGVTASNSYYEIMDHPGSPGRRMLQSRLANQNHLDLGNSTDDMEFPMTPQSESSSNTLPKQGRSMMNTRMNSKVVPKKIYKGSFREVNARSKAGGFNTMAELFPDDLKPVSSPKHALPAALLQVQASDWETNVDGFRQLVRLARHHPEFIRSDLHNVNMNALRHVMNLRSQVCRAAILFFRELFINVGKAMEHDSERIAEKLLDKAADTNKFIREDSGKALEALVLNVSPAKALTCLDLYGTRHRNPAVRCMTARMTTKLIEKLGADRSLSEVPERLLPMLCRFLQEGSLDTRMSAKLAFSNLMESSSFDNQLKRHVPADTLRHVQKAMKAITNKS